MKSQNKFYAVVSQNKNYLHGVFPYSEEGKEQAKKYIETLKKTSVQTFEIIEK